MSRKLRILKKELRQHPDDFEAIEKRLRVDGIYRKVKRSGTVTKYNHKKGFGWILDSEGREFFLHATHLKKPITTGDNVTFKIIPNTDRASEIEIVLE